jgi:hypothetical protein
MADKRISQLVDRGTVANNDVVPIVVSGATTTNKATISSIQTYMQGNLDLGVTSVGITLGSSGTDVSVSGSPITSSGNITINIPTASATNRGLLSAADWSTFNSKQQAITLTTTGTSGAATLVSGTLNIPNYSTDLSGYVTLGTAQTITAQKTFTTSGSSDTMIISHGSGSGFALDVLKAGSGEAIRVTKTSGSGNAMTISGGNFEAPTIVKTGGTSAQFLKADGSVDSSTYLTTDTNQSITGFKSFVNGFSLASEGGTNQPTTFINTGSIHEGSASTNQIGFNNSNNIYFGKGLNNGGVLQWTNSAVRYYTLPDADGTLALTTDLSAYLPLTGGTLSNNLFITGGGLQVSGSASANRQVVELYTSSTVSRLAASYVGSSSYGDLELLTGGLARLTIAAAGAATFSGALNGTSASFSGSLTGLNGILTGVGGVLSRTGATTTAVYGLFLNTSGGLYFGSEGSSGGTVITGNPAYFGAVSAVSGLGFSANNGNNVHLSIASTGAATFSSSVQGNRFFSVGSLNSTDGSFYIDHPSVQTWKIGITNSNTSTFSIGNDNGGAFGNKVFNITNSGNVGIGTASASGKLYVKQSTANFYDGINCYASSNDSFTGLGNTGSLAVVFSSYNTTAGSYSPLAFYTSDTERMRITSGGFTKARANGGSYFNGSYHEIVNNNNVSGDRCLVIGNAAGSNTNNTSSVTFVVADSGNDRLLIYGNGNVVNQNGSYGSISDVKLKENIEDATPKLDDLMKVKVRNYNLIGDDKKQIGVIAQELEEVFPAMIDDSEDFEEVIVPQVDEEGNEILNEEGEVQTTKERVSKGTTTKSVKYSVFVPMLIKAMQEQQDQIKELKTEIDSLKNQMQ